MKKYVRYRTYNFTHLHAVSRSQILHLDVVGFPIVAAAAAAAAVGHENTLAAGGQLLAVGVRLPAVRVRLPAEHEEHEAERDGHVELERK